MMNKLSLTQQKLLEAIFGNDSNTNFSSLGMTFDKRGLAIYRANLRATALQTLTITYPTVYALIGEELMAFASEKLLFSNPPHQGNWAAWGETFADTLNELDALEDYPFVADCARLDYVCHQGVRAADTPFKTDSLSLLNSVGPDDIKVELTPSLEIIESPYPIADIRSAHQLPEAERKQKLNTIAQDATEQTYRIACFKSGFEMLVTTLTPYEHDWLLLLEHHSLGEALGHIDLERFAFNPWLQQSVNNQLIHQFSMMRTSKTLSS
ncbi:MAG: DNA-binding domain-containing protein [Pseudomonadota bacterium]